jgi:hypothetical protein
MRRRLAALLLVFAVVFGAVTANDVMAAPPAAADGPIAGGMRAVCEPTVFGVVGVATGHDYCKDAGHAVETKISQEWNGIWNSELGQVIKAGEDAAKWVIRKTLTLALQGPSLRLQDTGLFGEHATLAGMLVWLGWVIAAFGLMWQLGKMAVTGQMKYAGQALIGWVQNALLTGIGLTMVALLLELGDEMTKGLVDSTFGKDGAAYDRILSVLLPPHGLANPVMACGAVSVLVTVGFIEMLLVFLRQSAIPVQCLLLPIAGAGRVGGEVTRQWAPRLITSILVAIAYKPILAVIICTGFAEVGNSQGLSEWLRGVATLVLGILAPGPLTKVFAPIGAEVGAGLGAAGAVGAAASVGTLMEARGGRGSSDDAEPTSAVQQAQYVQRNMPKSYEENGPEGQDVLAQASRNQTAAQVPSQAGAPEATGTGIGTTATTGATALTGPAGWAIQVFDGINDAVQRGADEMGGGNQR